MTVVEYHTMADSPPQSCNNLDEQVESIEHANEEFTRLSPEIDLNQVASKPDEIDADDCNLPAKAQQSPDEHDPVVNGGQQDPHSPLQDDLNRSPSSKDLNSSPSPKRSESPEAKGSSSPSKRDSKSPEEERQQSSNSGGRLASPERRQSPSPRGSSPSSERRQSLSPRKRYSPPSDGGKRRRYDHDRSLSRSPVARSARTESREHHGKSRSRSPPFRSYGRSRSPPPRDYGRSPRSRYSPRGRYSPRRRVSPPRYPPRRVRSPRRRPWSPPRNRSTGYGKPGNNLFIAGFSFVTTERDLEKKFSRYGRVTDVRIVRDKRSGDSRGFGFLTLERDEDADAAIKGLDQTEWNGRIVLVEKAKTSARY